MAATYLPHFGAWAYSCEYGCFDYPYLSEIKASEAEDGHDCEFRRFQEGGRTA